MEANIEEFFTNDSNYINDKDDEKGIKSFKKSKKRVKRVEKSAKIAQYRCDAECGSNADLACSLSNMNSRNALSCCVTSLRSLAFDIRNLSSIHPGEELGSKIKKVCVKNDRIFYLMIVVTLMLSIILTLKLVFQK